MNHAFVETTYPFPMKIDQEWLGTRSSAVCASGVRAVWIQSFVASPLTNSNSGQANPALAFAQLPPLKSEADWLSQWTEDPNQLLAFCLRLGILSHLKTAIPLVQRHFPRMQRMSLLARQDPEEGVEWLTIKIIAKSSLEEGLAAYDRFLSDWVSSIKWPERGRIRLSYSVV